MPEASLETVLDILKDDADGVLRDWIDQAEEDGAKRTDLFSEKEERDQAGTMLRALRSGIKDTARDGDLISKIRTGPTFAAFCPRSHMSASSAVCFPERWQASSLR